MKVAHFEIEPFEGDVLWLGKSTLYSSGPILVKLTAHSDPYVYSEARLLGEVTPEASFKLIDLFLDEARGLAGYGILLPGRVSKLSEAASGDSRVACARRIAGGLLNLHKSGIAYRSFAASSFLIAGDQGVPCDFSRATRIREENGRVRGIKESDDIAEAHRVLRDYDPPEARDGWYDGVCGDIYGLGFLLEGIGLDASACSKLIARMIDADPSRRPQSVALVLEELDHFLPEQ